MGPERTRGRPFLRGLTTALFGTLIAASLAGCGTAGGSSSGKSPAPAPSVSVSISPAGASLYLGQKQQFTATVTGASNTAVNWSVNGVAGGNTTLGKITAQGVYTAPRVLPSTADISVTATSQADSTASATVTVTLKSDVQVTVSPASASVTIGSTKQFTATVTGSGNPDTSVNWSLTGSACPANCGTLSINRNTATYTAPAAVPSTQGIQIVITSVADPSKSATANLTIAPTCSPAVSVSPAMASISIGGQQALTAKVCFSTNQNVTWSISGTGCSGSNCGTVTSTGTNTATYTAPASLPPTNPVTVVATSAADSTQTASASITITAVCSPAISITPATASIATGAQQMFTAAVCFSTNQNVTWSISGTGCSGSNCGTVTSTGANTAMYTAPASLPPTNPVTVVATSAADSTQTASASLTITAVCATPISVSPSAATVALGQQLSFTASVCFTTDQSVSWSISGTNCSGTSCGTISSTGASTGSYTAPSSLPPASPVTIVAASMADPSQTGTASVTVVSAVSVSMNTVSAEVAVSQRVSLSANVAGTTNQAVTWSVEGVTNGNTTLGEICFAGSSPCSPPPEPTASAVDYLAPSAVPNPAGVYVTATSAADSSRSATAEMTVLPHLSVSLAPANLVVAPSGTVEFAATVTGSQNGGVTWKVACAGSACGTITTNGVYNAPASAPSPNAITITATSQADPNQSATATVALTSAVALSTLSPSSVTAGAASGFTVAVTGYDFVPTSPGPGTTLLVNGVARTTTCTSSTACTVTISAADVASAATIEIAAKNPDGTQSNSLPLVAEPADGPVAVVSLSPSEPVAGAENITAVEPTTDGSGTGPMTVIFLGRIDAGTNTCNVNEAPIELARPSTGTTSYAICLGGSGLDPTYSYAIAGSQSSDVTVSNPQWFAGSLVAITLTISSAAAPGPRTLIVTDPNNDRAAASGAIDVE